MLHTSVRLRVPRVSHLLRSPPRWWGWRRIGYQQGRQLNLRNGCASRRIKHAGRCADGTIREVLNHHVAAPTLISASILLYASKSSGTQRLCRRISLYAVASSAGVDVG